MVRDGDRWIMTEIEGKRETEQTTTKTQENRNLASIKDRYKIGVCVCAPQPAHAHDVRCARAVRLARVHLWCSSEDGLLADGCQSHPFIIKRLVKQAVGVLY